MANSAFSALISSTGTASQIDVTPGLYPINSISANPILPGTGGTRLPSGNTAARAGGAGTVRFNSQTLEFESTVDGIAWTTFSGAGGPILSITGTANQIGVTAGANPVVSIANNPVLPGTGGTTLPTGNTAQRAGAAGTIRFNSQTSVLEGTVDGVSWFTFIDADGPIISITGTANRITVSAGPTPVVDIAATYVGQTSITTLGTITTGVWNGTAVDPTHGGTGLTSTTINQILYSSAANTIAGLPTANSAALTTTAAGVPAWSASMTNGQLLIGSTGATPSVATLTALANSGISITNGAASISVGTNGVLKSFQIFTSGTAATYTKPAGINNILVECVGGGGAGGGCVGTAVTIGVGAGGGAGGYCRKLFTSAAASYTYTVGAAGAAGAAGNNPGGNGGDTTFSTMTASGGTGGAGDAGSASSHTSGGGLSNGGSASGGDINQRGGPGQYGFTSLVAYGIGGQGGNSYFGGGASQFPSTGSATNGNAAFTNSGGGGGGAIAANAVGSQSGGAGGAGLIIVWEFV